MICMNRTHYTSLRRMPAWDLVVDDVFIFHRQNLYRVVCLSPNYIHCLNLTTERMIRFSRSTAYTPDYVYLMVEKAIPGIVEDFPASDFMLSPALFLTGS